MKKVMRLCLLTLIVAVTMYVVGVLVFQRRVIFPRAFEGNQPSPSPKGAMELSIPTDQGASRAWLLPPSADAPNPLVVFLHGNGETIEDARPVVRGYHALGFAVLLPEYRGYGQSEGTPSADKIVEDLVALVQVALARPEVDSTRVAYHGYSLGGGFAVALAARRAPGALVLESTFRSIPAVAAKLFVPSVLILDELPSERDLATLDVPVLIIHGRSDQLIPPDHAASLKRAAKNAELLLLEGGHATVGRGDAYWQAIRARLAGLGPMEESDRR